MIGRTIFVICLTALVVAMLEILYQTEALSATAIQWLTGTYGIYPGLFSSLGVAILIPLWIWWAKND